MKGRVCTLVDRIGNDYLGFKFFKFEIQPMLDRWKLDYRSSSCDLMTQEINREERDGEYFHSTLLSVREYNSVDKRDAVAILGLEYTFTVCGIGKAYEKGNEAQFIVLECAPLQDYRTALGLPERDFHITLGFDRKDVFTQSKGRSSIYIHL